MKTKSWLIELIPYVLAVLFFYTAIETFCAMDDSWWASALPMTELLLTFLLIWPKTTMIGLCAASIWLSTFTACLSILIMSYDDREPYSFPAFDYIGCAVQLWTNTLYLIMSLAGIYHMSKKY